MGKTEHEQGIASESVVHKICEKIFLSDFVVSNPKYKKSNNQEKEIADTLILFDTHLIGFQTKSKTETKNISEKNDTDIGRILNQIVKGIKQLKSIKTAIEAHEKLNITNKINVEITFDTSTVQKITGIVILDLLGEAQFDDEEKTEILGGFERHFGIPVHIFLRSDLELISMEIDTPADFIQYLEKRGELYDRGILMPTVSERDFLAVYKLQPGLIEDALSGKVDSIAIAEGHWDMYTTKLEELRNERTKLNHESYFVDRIIREMHKTIGYESPELEGIHSRNDIKQGTVEGYFRCVTVLSKLNRLERRAVGNVLYRNLKKADETGFSAALYQSPDTNKGIFILASNRNRRERATALYNLTAMAYCYYNLNEIAGIATDNLSASGRSYDFAFLKDVEFENRSELAEAGKINFASGKQFNFNEYTGKLANENEDSNRKK
ncbi:MAG: hypothetical protein A3F11_10155 [Gammaproteobacteria bacterium RIFCSPHIGHO2_12_FULL_37_14]|nr:MAG: hypothetical protein A3F11_10155 [Gammaproteobacteria bacterium RIFCSPHIGHO2_12_FULL_37_14]